MKKSTLWSLRLGYSAKQADTIENTGLEKFLKQSFAASWDAGLPDFMQNSPKTPSEVIASVVTAKKADEATRKQMQKEVYETSWDMKGWWVDSMRQARFPLREKMTCFWHNHYVSSFKTVKVNYWIYRHNMILRENAFGNFKDLTKQIVKSNAMVRYLDNADNKKDHYNENLSRELLELFTLGIGNYTEQDIKNGAKGLAGLGIGLENAQYRPAFENNEPFEYFGRKGNFKADEMVDIIFEQPEIPYLLTRKILKWFIYDHPDEALVRHYGDYFKAQNFELKPLLLKIFTEEYAKDTAGSKIKDPLEYIIQLTDELNIEKPKGRMLAYFAMQQGMHLFNQPNVKGWDGGTAWLTSQLYLQRNNVADLLCGGRNFNRQYFNNRDNEMAAVPNNTLNVKVDWDKKGSNKQIIAALKDRLLFAADADLQADFVQILKHDFDPDAEGADNALLRLFNAMAKAPEYQLI